MHSSTVFHRSDYATSMADQLLRPTALQLQVRSGVFLYGIRRIGKTTFLQQDLIPALETKGALVIYLDLWADRSKSPVAMVHEAMRVTFKSLSNPGSNLLRKLTSLKAGVAGFSFSVQLDTLGAEGGATLADAFKELVDKVQTDVVLIVDEIQQAAGSEDGNTLMHALKAARDAVNTRRGTPGYFLFLGTGSHKSLVADMASRRAQPFAGAMAAPYEPLGDDFVRWKLSTLAAILNVKLPNEWIACKGFETMGRRPEELQKALLQLQTQAEDPDVAFPIICSTLATATADVEFATLSSLGSLAEIIFDRLARTNDRAGPQLFSASALEEYGNYTGAIPQVPQVQNTLEKLIDANLVMRQGHGNYTVADPFVREVWRQRQETLSCVAKNASSDCTSPELQ